MRRKCKEELERVSDGGNTSIHSMDYIMSVSKPSGPRRFLRKGIVLYLSVTDPYIVPR